MWYDQEVMDNSSPPSSYMSSYYSYMESLVYHNPTYEYRFWNKREVLKLWKHPLLIPWYLKFSTTTDHIEKCIMTRYAIMFVYGGIYIDLDFMCIRELDPILDERDIILCYESSSKRRISNGVFCSKPEHPFWSQILDSDLSLTGMVYRILEKREYEESIVSSSKGSKDKGCDSKEFENKELIGCEWFSLEEKDIIGRDDIVSHCLFMPSNATECKDVESYIISRWTGSTDLQSEYLDEALPFVLSMLIILVVSYVVWKNS